MPELQELQAVGVSAVSVHINFPILYEPYYGDTQDFQNYVNFYQQLAQQIHALGMKMTVETTVASAGAGSNGAIYSAYYSTLAWNDYMTGRAQNAVNVAQLIQPDYMSVITEPDSESQNSGQPNAGTPSGSLQELQTILAAMQAANVTNVPVGAGAGTWINSFTTYIQNVISTPVSYVDLHMYTVSNSYPENALTAATMAHAAGLPITMSETWCKKISAANLAGTAGALNNESVDALGAFSFWEPLDQMYLQTLVNMAQAGQFKYISPFWTSQYFSYLDYGTYGSQTPDQVMAALVTAAGSARQIGAFTPVALTWETSILPSPDVTAPQVPSPPAIGQVGQNIVQLFWTPTTDNIGVAGYNLFRNGTLLYTSSQVNYNDNTVSPSTAYTYQVQAFDAAGNLSALSAPASTTTLSPPDQAAPSTPSGLQGVGTSDLSLKISWQPSTDNVAVSGYHVYRGSTATALSILAATTTPSYTDTSNMYPKTTFYYAVTAFDASGNNSPMSAAIAVTTLADTTLPTVPAALTATAQGPQQVAVSWSPSTDDVKVVGYSISRGKTPTSMITVGNTTSTSFVDTSGLAAATNYYYAVSAYDEASNYSASSPMATVTTLPVSTPPTVSLQTSASPSNIGQTVTFTATVRLTSGTIPNGETVAFKDGGTQIGTGTTNAGVATFSTSSLAVGSHSVTATYAGDGVYQTATSSAVNQVVIKNSTNTTVTSSANPSAYGESVTFTASVSSPGATPTGSVTFKNGSTAIGSATLANGVAAFSTSTLATGNSAITAAYGGDASSATSTSSALTETVNASTISISLTASANPTTDNKQVSFTAALTGSYSGSPTGTVTFSQNGTAIGSPVAVSKGTATISTSFAAAGTYSITAAYSGDANFGAAHSAQPIAEVITAGSTTTTIVSSGSPAALGSPITFTATVHPTGGTVPNGETVTFSDGTTVIGSGVTGGGAATFTTSALAVGTHSITASYAGDANLSTSKSAPVSEVISKNATTTTVTSNLNPSTYEQSVTFTAKVSSTGVMPTGSVTFKNGATSIGSGTLSNGTASFSTATLATGTNAITVSYGGDADSLSSTSATLNQVVNSSAATLALKSSKNPSTPNQQVTFTATLTVPSGNPTGTITFSENGTMIGSPVSVASKQASVATSFTATGTYTITAVYSGDANFSSVTAPALSQVISAASTTITVQSSASRSPVGAPVTFTATMHPATGTIPNGEVITFLDGSTTIGTGTTASGVASFTTSSLAVGTHSITASYAGDANFAGSTSTAISETIAVNTTTTTVTSNLNPSTYGQAVAFSATVTSAGATPTGTVTFKNGTTVLGQATLTNGVGVFTTASLAAGTNSITATYGGDAFSSGGTSAALSQTVNMASTVTVIASSLNPSTQGKSVKFTATVTSSTASPTGTVTFTQGSTVLGTATLVGGTAGLSTTALPSGSDVITATYNGSANVAASSGTFTQTVN